jgi:hypothetical protein
MAKWIFQIAFVTSVLNIFSVLQRCLSLYMPKNDVIIYCYLWKLPNFIYCQRKKLYIYFQIYESYSVLELNVVSLQNLEFSGQQTYHYNALLYPHYWSIKSQFNICYSQNTTRILVQKQKEYFHWKIKKEIKQAKQPVNQVYNWESLFKTQPPDPEISHLVCYDKTFTHSTFKIPCTISRQVPNDTVLEF